MNWPVIAEMIVTLLENVLSLISAFRNKATLNDDLLLKVAQDKQGTNSQLYKTLKAHLASLPAQGE